MDACHITAVAVFKSRHIAEDAATMVVKDYYAQITAKILVPKRILIVEEAQVACDAEHHGVCGCRMPHRRRHTAVDAVHSTVAAHPVSSRMSACQSYGGTVSIVCFIAVIHVFKLAFEISHC